MALVFALVHNIQQFKGRSPEDLLRLFGPSPLLPIDIEGLAHLISIKVERMAGMKWDGIIFRQGPAIYVAKERSPERQRFTIAHGIGHLLLHKGEEYREDFLTISEEEREANRFAIDLLMPQYRVMNYVGYPVKEIAERFGVSIATMKYRLNELGYYCPVSAFERLAEEEFLG